MPLRQTNNNPQQTGTLFPTDAIVVDTHPQSLYPTPDSPPPTQVSRNPAAEIQQEAYRFETNRGWDLSAMLDPTGGSAP